MASHVADGFFNVAARFFGALPAGLNESARAAVEQKGELAAAATALALSIELYLKALAIRCGQRPLRTHDLGKLFSELPNELRSSIETAYTDVCNRKPRDAPATLELFVTTTPFPPTEAEVAALQQRTPDNASVRCLLNNEKDAFRNWRYVYESDMPSGVSFVRIEYDRFGIAAKILKEHLTAASCP
jgi:HEPN domain-containing protein